ncbi:MAG: phosphotransferase family protein [Pseudomonadota bacterium]
MTVTEKTDKTPTLDEIVLCLERCMRRHFGQRVSVANVKLATLGGSNRTILFDLVEGRSKRRLVSRQETYTLDPSPFLPPETQFKLLRLAYEFELAVPEPILEFEPSDQLGRGHVVAHVSGETLPKRLLNDEEFSAARKIFPQQAGEFLAALHTIPAQRADFLANIVDSIDPLRAQIERYDYYGEPHPAIEFAFRWLDKNKPPTEHRTLIHGDFRVGNMLIDASGIKAVLDWECAHLGDPMADLGWLMTPAWRFGHFDLPVGGVGHKEDLYQAYEAAGGQRVDEERVRWWQIFGSLRWCIFNLMQVHGHRVGGRRSPAFAACGRNAALIEYEMLQMIAGNLD